jgi:imidazolonepropionase-like amidohydrolase
LFLMKKICFLVALCTSALVWGQKTYIQCGGIYDPATQKTSSQSTVIVEGTKILSIASGWQSGGASDQLVDLKTATLMPGWIDLHVHIESEIHPETYLNKFLFNKEDVAFESVAFAQKTLQAGFTSVRDLGGSGVNIALRKAIARGSVDGPRIWTAGKSIASTGGHADPTNGVRADLMGDPGPAQGVINSVDEARKAVRQRYKEGADVIKITATGGVMSMAKNGHNPQFTVEEIKAIVETAADYGMLTAAHAHGDEGMRRAVVAGIKTIEHGSFMSEATMELMKKHDAYLVPTLSAAQHVMNNAKIPGYYPPMVTAKALEVGPITSATFAKAYQKGVNIAFGTDSGVSHHGDNAREFIYMEQSGMPFKAALKAATTTNAALLGMEDQLGRVAPGFLADLIALSQHPDHGAEAALGVVFVMKDGRIYKQPTP